VYVVSNSKYSYVTSSNFNETYSLIQQDCMETNVKYLKSPDVLFSDMNSPEYGPCPEIFRRLGIQVLWIKTAILDLILLSSTVQSEVEN